MNSAPRPLLIVNPTAGAGRAGRVVGAIRAALSQLAPRAELVATRGPGHAEELAQQGARAGYGPIVGVGGDGTFQELANGLLREPDPPPLGVIPAGTGDDFARSLGVPAAPERALRAICRGATTPIDVGLCGERYFLNAAGVGFDAAVAAAARRHPRWRVGAASYLFFLAAELRRHRNREILVEIDGRVLRRRSLSVTVANGPSYGGGLRVCPAATLLDGWLDVCIVGDVARWEILTFLPRLRAGRPLRHPKVEYHRARAVRIEAWDGIPAHLDGEPLGPAPFELRVAPRTLAVVGMGHTAAAREQP